MKSILQAIAFLCVIVATGGASVALLKPDVPDMAIPDANWQAGSILDGQVFYTVDHVVETGDIITDEFHFVDGTFQSAMCQVYCDFGWSEYQTWTEGDVIHFTATTRCPDAPHTVVFMGTVTGDEIAFEGTWTTRRWYWTHQINVVGAGSLTPPTDTEAVES